MQKNADQNDSEYGHFLRSVHLTPFNVIITSNLHYHNFFWTTYCARQKLQKDEVIKVEATFCRVCLEIKIKKGCSNATVLLFNLKKANF